METGLGHSLWGRIKNIDFFEGTNEHLQRVADASHHNASSPSINHRQWKQSRSSGIPTGHHEGKRALDQGRTQRRGVLHGWRSIRSPLCHHRPEDGPLWWEPYPELHIILQEAICRAERHDLPWLILCEQGTLHQAGDILLDPHHQGVLGKVQALLQEVFEGMMIQDHC